MRIVRRADSVMAWLSLAVRVRPSPFPETMKDNPFFGALYDALDNNELPPFDVLAKYFSPTGTVVTNTETGIHWMEFSMKRKPD